MRREGPVLLGWIRENAVFVQKFDACAKVLSKYLFSQIRTSADARMVWRGVPRALNHCDADTMHEDRGVVLAYAWLHFLERYARAWQALEHLVEKYRLPMGSQGVRALDVGSGLGPTAFAIHDFYSAMLEFSDRTSHPAWRQPIDVTCIEKGTGFNVVRHHLAEMMSIDAQIPSVLSICGNLADYKEFRPQQERRRLETFLRREEDEYFDEELGMWISDPVYTREEANTVSQSLHRYRLFSFSNFLTSQDSVTEFKPNLIETLRDARPGSVLFVIGGTGSKYKKTYELLGQLALHTGFRDVVSTTVSSVDSKVADSVYEEARRLYHHLQYLSATDDGGLDRLHEHFRVRSQHTSSALRTFRKFRYP